MRGRLVSSLFQLAANDNGVALERGDSGIVRSPLPLSNFLLLLGKVLGRFSFLGSLSCHDQKPKKILKSSVYL